MNETLSPEILDPNNELYQAILQNINEQKEKIEQSTNVLEKGVYELELKRIRYMLHSWKRKRLMKLQKHVFYYIPSSENSQNSSQSQVTSALIHHNLQPKTSIFVAPSL